MVTSPRDEETMHTEADTYEEHSWKFDYGEREDSRWYDNSWLHFEWNDKDKIFNKFN